MEIKLDSVSVTGDVINSPDPDLAYSIDWLRLEGEGWEFTFDFDGHGGASVGLEAWLAGDLYEAYECELINGHDFEEHLKTATYAEVGVWPLAYDGKEADLESVYFENVIITVELGNARRTFDTHAEASLAF